eukprot:GHVN01057556.1.p1 GENE.GHVN01057556.1~~GHVN01057556.1.p1  ORF type:complete len:211 (-),score=33.50 GHVN01057556.1:1906-2538(-)
MKKKAALRKGKEADPNATSTLLSMGYGFVRFQTSEDAANAIKLFQGVVVDDHALRLSFAKGNQESIANSAPRAQKRDAATDSGEVDLSKVSNKILVRNLAFEATNKDLRNLFSAFGTVTGVRTPKKIDGTSRGYGFIEFLTKSEALSAMEALQHTHLYGRRLVLEPSSQETDTSAKLAQLKAERFEEITDKKSRAEKRRKIDEGKIEEMA